MKTLEDKIKEKVEALIEHDVLCCQTVLIEELRRPLYENTHLQIDSDDIINFYYDDLIKNMRPDLVRDDVEEDLRDGKKTQEIFEWWLVTRWLSDKLIGIGAPVVKTLHGNYWGRTESGLGLSVDSSLNIIARILVEEWEDLK